MIHEADERVARMRQGHAVTNASAVELFAFMQSPQQRLPGIGLFRDINLLRTMGPEFFINKRENGR